MIFGFGYYLIRRGKDKMAQLDISEYGERQADRRRIIINAIGSRV